MSNSESNSKSQETSDSDGMEFVEAAAEHGQFMHDMRFAFLTDEMMTRDILRSRIESLKKKSGELKFRSAIVTGDD